MRSNGLSIGGASARRGLALAWLLGLLALSGCGGDADKPSGNGSDSAVGGDAIGSDADDAGTDAGGDVADDAAADAANPDAGGDDGAIDPIAWGQSGLKPIDKVVAPPAEPEPVATSAFAVAAFFQGDTDVIGGALLAGTLTMPEEGALVSGKVWKQVEPDAGGQLPAVGNPAGTMWALFEVDCKAETRLLVQADRAYELRWKGGRLPGDIYGSGKMRLPVKLPAGKHLLGMRGRGGQKLRVKVWQVPEALWIDPHDPTHPDLRVGHNDPLWLGLPVLEWDGSFAKDVRTRVVGGEWVEQTEVAWPGLVPGGATQLGWKIVPKKAPTQATLGNDAAGKPIPLSVEVTLQVWTDTHEKGWEARVKLQVREGEQTFRQTFRDAADASVQYYGVRPPRDFDPQKKDYALMLSLHGAGVEGIGQAGSYGAKTWLWHVTPTNRRPFGFDWEEWGHLNGLHALDDATARFAPDPTRIYLGGHSMGGHGTWQFAVHHHGRFAVMGPSAGWDSFYTYGGASKPTGPFARARAHSDTSHFAENLRDRSVYVIHGTADDNVPWSEGKAMLQHATVAGAEVDHHWQQGAGHWWDGDKGEGADCVDWPPLFELMQKRTLDPTELNFHWRSPGPYYTHQHSYLTIDAATSPTEDTMAESVFDGATLKLTLQNVRRSVLDGKAIRAKGPQSIVVTGAGLSQQTLELPDGPLVLGEEGGKRVGQCGPFNQAFQRAFAFVVPDDNPTLRAIAAYWATSWQMIGNGHAVVLPASAAAHARAAGRNVIWFGAVPSAVEDTGLAGGSLPVDLQLPGQPGAKADASGPTIAGVTIPGAAVLSVFPRGAGVDAVLWAPADKLGLLYAVLPFSSRSGLPDWMVWEATGVRATGYWSSDWKNVDPAATAGL
ncbi:MAG: hypothetical protein RIT45_2957 [Pseudomonadota bacterium]